MHVMTIDLIVNIHEVVSLVVTTGLDWMWRKQIRKCVLFRKKLLLVAMSGC